MQSKYNTGDVVYIPVRLGAFAMVGPGKERVYSVDQMDLRFVAILEDDIEELNGVLFAVKKERPHDEKWPF